MESSEEYSETLSVEIPDQELRTQEYMELASKVATIHSSFLFLRDNLQTNKIAQLCSEIYITLVRRVGGTRDDFTSPGWKELAHRLGLLGEEINYIDNSVKNCPTETTLRVFSQDNSATMKCILEVLIEMKRYDVVEGIYYPVKSLLEELINNNERECDQGYHSDSRNETKMFVPDYFINNLPEVLRKHHQNKKGDDPSESSENTLTSNISLKPQVEKPAILLTYYDDGIGLVHKIIDVCKSYSIRAICLEDEKFTILMNKEQYIRHYFNEVDYVVPILTDGYYANIKSSKELCNSIMDNVDCTHVKYIFTLMSTNYINGTSCLNMNVRGVMSNNIKRDVMREINNIPVLCAWIREDEINEFFHQLSRSGSE